VAIDYQRKMVVYALGGYSSPDLARIRAPLTLARRILQLAVTPLELAL
jgi:hypothetical protein